MELFTKLFGDLLAFVYHCFDRVVIHGYVTRLCRPEHVVYFFREVVGVPVITKEILRQRTEAYQSGSFWVWLHRVGPQLLATLPWYSSNRRS